MAQIPSFAEEKVLEAQGYRHIAGIDEVGRGALAGPVVAAAVILPHHHIDAPWLSQVRDSKQLSPARRQLLFHHIHEIAVAVGIGIVTSEVIDTQGIIKATRLAMKAAVGQLPLPQFLLIDYMLLPDIKLPQKGIKYGDSLCFSIACASIIAKVARDQMMVEFDRIYPGYRLAQHKGYGTKEHLACLRKLGPSPIHRQSFKPVKIVMEHEA